MKKRITPVLLGALALLTGSVSTASAQPAPTEKPVPPQVLKKYDLNKDGVLDEAERAAWLADKKAAAAAKKNNHKAAKDMKPEPVK